MAKKRKRKKGRKIGAGMICPKTVKAGKRSKKVIASGGRCYARRADGTKGTVRKVKRGHKGAGSWAKRAKKKRRK